MIAVSWHSASAMTGGAAGVLGLGAGSARFLDAGPGTTICFCVASVLCAAVAGTVAIVGTVAGRPAEVRRMAAFQSLARRVDGPKELRCAMAMLALYEAVVRGEIKDVASLAQAILPDQEADLPSSADLPFKGR